MWKTVVAGAAALAIAGTSYVYAQQRDHGAAGMRNHGPRLSQEDRAAFTDARIAALKAALKLTPDQEKNWPAFKTALRDIAKQRMDRRTAWRDEMRGRDGAGDPVERLRQQAERLSTAGANLNKLADAQEPLYKSFDDSQKKRFQIMAHVLMAQKQHFAQMRRHERNMHGHDRGGMRGPGGPNHGQPMQRGGAMSPTTDGGANGGERL